MCLNRTVASRECRPLRLADSCVGVWRNGRVEIIANDQGNRITPSYVAWTSDDQRLIGDAAKNQASSNPSNTVYDAKRLIGRKFGDATVQADMKHWPFEVADKGGKPVIRVTSSSKKDFSAEESAMVRRRRHRSAHRDTVIHVSRSPQAAGSPPAAAHASPIHPLPTDPDQDAHRRGGVPRRERQVRGGHGACLLQ